VQVPRFRISSGAVSTVLLLAFCNVLVAVSGTSLKNDSNLREEPFQGPLTRLCDRIGVTFIKELRASIGLSVVAFALCVYTLSSHDCL
jgi:hypothetical protein